ATHTKFAVLAETGIMLPMCCLLIVGTYRLGKSVVGDTAGGFASLFLFFTFLFLRGPGMRGTAVVFVALAIGLAFFLESRRKPIFGIVGALALGTSVATHSLVGGIAMLLGSIALLIWLVQGDIVGFAFGFCLMLGATLLAI